MVQPPIHVGMTGISKTYDGHSFVVRDLNLEIAKGEFLTLLGPSGSGKTTTLMMLAGFEYPSSGEITLDGRPIQDKPPEKRNIGMVFQNYALFPHMTVAENVGYSLRVRGLSKEQIGARVGEALAMVQLSNLAQRKPTALSGGQQQRVALARALVFEPSLVLMDEPLGALDKKLREDLQLEIRRIADRLDLTVVYVTHDQHEALTMSDKIAIFSDGCIQQIGSAQEIYGCPANRFVAEFVGDNNCLDAKVVSIEGDLVRARLVGGQEMRARSSVHSKVDQRATIAIRPESVRIAVQERAETLRGQVCDVIYCGDQFRIHVELPGGERLIAKSSSSLGVPMEKGRPVLLDWEPHDAWALDGRQRN
ncbi:polyamine ABC transporter ATP-binding protein [Mesorhizobium alhagi CCNWXJ12-2]|uniref:Spermidine/putrescine import ATP-binding protein PotA n=2 Tax=Allomesorhizobium alhagi TaxID=475067 RepID=H0HWT7_9HYPH|nr:polyamine ABC transporter ATP-binding protein [Mesorhizobium alhagi CCNWXJ12-2]